MDQLGPLTHHPAGYHKYLPTLPLQAIMLLNGVHRGSPIGSTSESWLFRVLSRHGFKYKLVDWVHESTSLCRVAGGSTYPAASLPSTWESGRAIIGPWVPPRPSASCASTILYSLDFLWKEAFGSLQDQAQHVQARFCIFQIFLEKQLPSTSKHNLCKHKIFQDQT